MIPSTAVSNPTFRLQFPAREIRYWASRYSYPGEDHIVEEVAPRARDRGWLVKDELTAIGTWKSPRIRSRCASNDDGFVEEVTRTSLSARSEKLRIEVLTLLFGVEWPTASVILHFCHEDAYPILDYRALWSLGCRQPNRYTFPFWERYVEACRRLASEHDVDMRTLDRALWQYSKEKQPRGNGDEDRTPA